MRRSSKWLPSSTVVQQIVTGMFVVSCAVGCSTQIVPGNSAAHHPAPPPSPSSGPVGPASLNLVLPTGWVDNTATKREKTPNIAAAGINAVGDEFTLQLMTSSWGRFEDVPVDERERYWPRVFEILKPMLQAQGYERINVLGQGSGVLNGLPALTQDYEATRRGVTVRSRGWATWYQGNSISASITVGAQRWTETVRAFEPIMADLRLPPELLRRGTVVVTLTRPNGWTDFSAQHRAGKWNNILAFRSPANGAFMLSAGESTYASFESVPESTKETFRRVGAEGQLALLRRGGYRDAELVSQETGVLAGLPAIVMEYSAKSNQEVYRWRQITTWYRYRQVSVMLQAPANRWEESAPGFEMLLADPRLRAAVIGDAAPPEPPVLQGNMAAVTTGGRTLYTNSWAVIIGIDRYQKPGLRLRYAVNDARSIRELVLRLGFPAENITLLLDEQATKQRIQEVLGDELRTHTSLDDRVFVFFAGHGVTLDLPGGGQMGYLLAVESDPDRPHTTAIAMSEVRDVANLVPAKHMFFAIDACYSGLASQRSAVAMSPADQSDPYVLVRGRLREILTAGERDQPVVEESGHGLFTRRLIEGLSGEADFAPHDGMITGVELAYWLIPRVQVSSGNRQTPFFGKMDGVGDFVFVAPSRP
jgi:hypothetical protein